MSVYVALKVAAGENKTGADVAPFGANVKLCVKESCKSVSIKDINKMT